MLCEVGSLTILHEQGTLLYSSICQAICHKHITEQSELVLSKYGALIGAPGPFECCKPVKAPLLRTGSSQDRPSGTNTSGLVPSALSVRSHQACSIAGLGLRSSTYIILAILIFPTQYRPVCARLAYCMLVACNAIHNEGLPTYARARAHTHTRAQESMPCSLLGSGVRLLEVMKPLQHLLEVLNPRSDSFLRASYEQQRRLSSTAFPSQVVCTHHLLPRQTTHHQCHVSLPAGNVSMLEGAPVQPVPMRGRGGGVDVGAIASCIL